MWAAGVVLVLSVAAWGASLFAIHTWNLRRLDVGVSLSKGMVYANNSLSVGQRGGHLSLEFSHMATPNWWPDRSRFFRAASVPGLPLIWKAAIPLWIPAVASGGLLVSLWVAGVRRRRRGLVGHCPTCGYDLTGTTGRCPECGLLAETSAAIAGGEAQPRRL